MAKVLETPNGTHPASGLLDGEAFLIEQYEKIARFRNNVLLGNHPTIKLPAGLLATARSSLTESIDQKDQHDDIQAASGNTSTLKPNNSHRSQPRAASAEAGSQRQVLSDGIPKLASTTSGLSDVAEPDEFQLKRRELENEVREEFEQRQSLKNAPSETSADLDLSNILAKALSLAQVTADPPPIEKTASANNEDASDSFDDDTFYSSRHDTPDSEHNHGASVESAVQPEVTKSDKGKAHRHELENRSTAAPLLPSSISADLRHHIKGNSTTSASTVPLSQPPPPDLHSSTFASRVPGLMHLSSSGFVASTREQAIAPIPSSSGALQGALQGRRVASAQLSWQPPHTSPPRLTESYAAAHPPSPLIRVHNLSPVQPQPTHFSTLTTSGPRLPSVHEAEIVYQAPAAQVSLLRHQHSTATSPESSSPAGKAMGKKKEKGKKNKRKADRHVLEAEILPDIKPEPRSPSPINAPSFLRPNKRQRRSKKQAEALSNDGLRQEPIVVADEPFRYYPYAAGEQRQPMVYDSPVAFPAQRVLGPQVGGGRRYVSGGYDDRMPVSTFAGQAPSPIQVAEQYDPRDPRTSSMGPGSHSIANGPQADAVRYFQAGPRPADGYLMGPPRPQTTRIMVDERGHEIIEPPQHPIRYSIAPPPRMPESEVIYERTPMRAMSRHGPMPGYDESSVAYMRPSSPYMTQRRVMTQPEYVSQDFGRTQYREYPPQQLVPAAGHYSQPTLPEEQTNGHDDGRVLLPRASTVRPAEATRYEVAPEYVRVQSVRPPTRLPDGAGNMRPDYQHTQPPPQYLQGRPSYPMTQQYPNHGFGTQPVERYYDPQLRTGDFAFMERPRAGTQEVLYADDARREIYR